MGNLTIKSVNISTTAEYASVENGMKINLNYTEDGQSKELKNLNGFAFHTPGDTFAGSFNGNVVDGELEYNFSNVKRKDMAALNACLSDIEEQIAGEEE